MPLKFPGAHAFPVMGCSETRLIAAITISGCSLLLLAFLRNKFTGHAESSREDETGKSTAKSAMPSGKKKVRFSEDVEEPSGNNVEYRRRHRKKSIGQSVVGEVKREKKKKWMDLHANRSALYSGIYRYRLQMSTVMVYGL